MGNLQGSVYTFGMNDQQQLCLSEDTPTNHKTPHSVNLPDDITPRQVSIRSKHVAILGEKEGKYILYSCGLGHSGQLGHGTLRSCTTLKRVDALLSKNIRQIACGKSFTKIIFIFIFIFYVYVYVYGIYLCLVTGDVYTWGGGLLKILGHEQNPKRPIPHIIEEFEGTNIIQVCCGAQYTVAVTSEGKVYSWGIGNEGQLGHGNFQNQEKPKLIEGLGGEKIRYAACGETHTALVGVSGSVYTFGNGQYGQLGNGKKEPSMTPFKIDQSHFKNEPVYSISCGTDHTIAVTRSGRVFVWGSNEFGQLGIAKIKSTYNPTELVMKNITIRQVACGDKSSFLVSSDPIFDSFSISKIQRPSTFRYVDPDIQNQKNLQVKPAYSSNKMQYFYSNISFDSLPSQSQSNENLNVEQPQKEEKKEDNQLDINAGPPDEFLCAITFEIMKDPVFCSDGFTYERFAIESWLSENSTSPMTGQELASKELIPNHSLREQIRASPWGVNF
ncbi:regulator of chromosome condensation [Anaeramoeba ignava]|uniref:Regulator of chromosome condensation n=1 Tax=Anaeramoeba ignava TaxID=1746090 RepID=A0A9Q0R828_ANAIG|nr:regulator of chromosome condensation [Anaeramoeba ignava]